MIQAFRQLQGFARSVAVLDLWPDREDGYDLADYFAAGFLGENLPLPNPRTMLSSLSETEIGFPMPKPSVTARIQELIPEDNPLRFTASADAAAQVAAMLKQRSALAEFLRKFSPCQLSIGDHTGPIQEWQLSV